MNARRIYLLIWCIAAGIFAYVAFEYWSQRNAPLHQRFERQWAADVRLLEESGKLPKTWSDVGQVVVFGGTPDTKALLRRIQIPVNVKKEGGGHKLEALVVLWEEEGKKGALVQYNLIEVKSKNTIFEIGRTLILAEKKK